MSEVQEKSTLLLPDRMNEREPTQLPAAQASPMAMLQIAVQRGDDIEKISKLMDLADRWNAQQARMAFVEAMAKFKENPPEILKDKKVSFQTTKGTTEYKHATLAGVCNAIIKGLSAVGISHRWLTEQLEGGRIKVTCILTHSGGHAENTALSSSPDDSGGKNNIQAIGSAVSYLQRYTLLAATGLATADMDDDGGGSDGVAYLSAEQLATVESLIDDIKPDVPALLKYAGVAALEDIPSSSYNMIVQAIRAAGKHKKAAA